MLHVALYIFEFATLNLTVLDRVCTEQTEEATHGTCTYPLSISKISAAAR